MTVDEMQQLGEMTENKKNHPGKFERRRSN